VRAGVAFDDAAFRAEPDLQSAAGSSAGSRAGSEFELLGLGASAATLHHGGAEPGGGAPAILEARGLLAAGDSHEERHRRLERQNAIDGEDSVSDAGFGSADDLEPEGGAGDSEPEGDDAGGAACGGLSPLPDQVTAAHMLEQLQQLRADMDGMRGTIREQEATIEKLADPEMRFSELQRMALEPAFQAIVGGKLSAAQIRRLRSYKLTESTIDTLVEKGVLPEGWPDPARYFGAAAFHWHLPKEQQLPMSPLQWQLLEGEVAYPEGWPERGEDYSHINATEWRMLQASQQQAVHAANDHIPHPVRARGAQGPPLHVRGTRRRRRDTRSAGAVRHGAAVRPDPGDLHLR
jgi:hypothetical protein